MGGKHALWRYCPNWCRHFARWVCIKIGVVVRNSCMVTVRAAIRQLQPEKPFCVVGAVIAWDHETNPFFTAKGSPLSSYAISMSPSCRRVSGISLT